MGGPLIAAVATSSTDESACGSDKNDPPGAVDGWILSVGGFHAGLCLTLKCGRDMLWVLMRLFLPFLMTSAALAAESLPDTIVTASRTDEKPVQAPAIVKKLDQRQIAERLPRTLPEAMRELPGVSIQKTSNGQGSPFIRGFTGFRTLMLVDGIRFNNSTFRDGPNQYWSLIDPLSVERLEVVPSQGSVLYGSDAIGGTVNALTKDSGFLSEAEGSFFTHGLASYRWNSAEHSHVEHLEASVGRGQKWGLRVGGTLSHFGDVVDGSGLRQPRTGYGQWAFDVRFDYQLDEHWLLTAVHQQSAQNDVWRTHATNQGVSFAGTTIGTDRVRLFDQARSLSYVRLAGKNLGGVIDAASLTLSLQTQAEQQFRVTGGGVRSFNDVDLMTLGADLQFESKTALGKLVYGVDFYHDWIESDATDNPWQGAVADDSSYDLLGIYAQNHMDFGERVHVMLGGRWTYARAEAGRFRDAATGALKSYSDAWSNFSGSVRFLIDLDDQDRWQVYGGVAQSFRAPNLSDLSRSDIALTGQVEVPSPGLSPEKYLTYELGIKAQTESVSASLGLFHTQIDDMIVRRPTGVLNQVSKSNGDSGFMHGIEASVRWQIDPHWSVFGHVAWVEGEADQYIGLTTAQRREPLGKISPLTGMAGVRWQRTDRKVWAELVALAYGEAARMNVSDQQDTSRIPANGTPSFCVLTLRGGWDVNEHLTLTAGVDNMLNKTYRYHGSGSNEPGLGVNLGATVKF